MLDSVHRKCSIKYPKAATSGKARSIVPKLVFSALVLLQKWDFFEMGMGFFFAWLFHMSLPASMSFSCCSPETPVQ